MDFGGQIAASQGFSGDGDGLEELQNFAERISQLTEFVPGLISHGLAQVAGRQAVGQVRHGMQRLDQGLGNGQTDDHGQEEAANHRPNDDP